MKIYVILIAICIVIIYCLLVMLIPSNTSKEAPQIFCKENNMSFYFDKSDDERTYCVKKENNELIRREIVSYNGFWLFIREV